MAVGIGSQASVEGYMRLEGHRCVSCESDPATLSGAGGRDSEMQGDHQHTQSIAISLRRGALCPRGTWAIKLGYFEMK